MLGFPPGAAIPGCSRAAWVSLQVGQDSGLAQTTFLHLHEPPVQDGRNVPVMAVSKRFTTLGDKAVTILQSVSSLLNVTCLQIIAAFEKL